MGTVREISGRLQEAAAAHGAAAGSARKAAAQAPEKPPSAAADRKMAPPPPAKAPASGRFGSTKAGPAEPPATIPHSLAAIFAPPPPPPAPGSAYLTKPLTPSLANLIGDSSSAYTAAANNPALALDEPEPSRPTVPRLAPPGRLGASHGTPFAGAFAPKAPVNLTRAAPPVASQSPPAPSPMRSNSTADTPFPSNSTAAPTVKQPINASNATLAPSPSQAEPVVPRPKSPAPTASNSSLAAGRSLSSQQLQSLARSKGAPPPVPSLAAAPSRPNVAPDALRSADSLNQKPKAAGLRGIAAARLASQAGSASADSLPAAAAKFPASASRSTDELARAAAAEAESSPLSRSTDSLGSKSAAPPPLAAQTLPRTTAKPPQPISTSPTTSMQSGPTSPFPRSAPLHMSASRLNESTGSLVQQHALRSTAAAAAANPPKIGKQNLGTRNRSGSSQMLNRPADRSPPLNTRAGQSTNAVAAVAAAFAIAAVSSDLPPADPSGGIVITPLPRPLSNGMSFGVAMAAINSARAAGHSSDVYRDDAPARVPLEQQTTPPGRRPTLSSEQGHSDTEDLAPLADTLKPPTAKTPRHSVLLAGAKSELPLRRNSVCHNGDLGILPQLAPTTFTGNAAPEHAPSGLLGGLASMIPTLLDGIKLSTETPSLQNVHARAPPSPSIGPGVAAADETSGRTPRMGPMHLQPFEGAGGSHHGTLPFSANPPVAEVTPAPVALPPPALEAANPDVSQAALPPSGPEITPVVADPPATTAAAATLQPKTAEDPTAARRRSSSFHSPVTLSKISRRRNSLGQIEHAELDADMRDNIRQLQTQLAQLKKAISAGSKINYQLYTEARYLEGRIALLLQNRISLEQRDLDNLGASPSVDSAEIPPPYPDVKKRHAYGSLLYILQTEPRHVTQMVKLASLNDIDSLLQTVMFTLFGNQYDSREEYLLLSVFQSVLASHFETTADFNELLRANTPVSRLMTTYIRRSPGQQYLRSVLSGRIYQLAMHENDDLEIQPVRIYEQVYQEAEANGTAGDMNPNPTIEEALADPRVTVIYEQRARNLMRIATHFLSIIIHSAEMVPYGIRWICRQIRSLCKRHYPRATEASICSLIGGFFLLRFVNPALVSPQAHMMIDAQTQITKNAKRTLTLVAKMLQNLANRPSYNKEEYMRVLGPFISTNKDRMNRFFLELCEVGDFYESLEIHQYIALSHGAMNVHMSLNELYNTHALVARHRDLLAPDPGHPLRSILDVLGDAPPNVSRAENRNVSVQLFPRWETLPIQVAPSSLAANTRPSAEADVLYMDTKALFVQLLRAMPLYVQSVREAKLDVKRIELHRPESTPTLTPQAIRDAIAAAQDMGVAPEESGVGRNVNTVILSHMAQLGADGGLQVAAPASSAEGHDAGAGQPMPLDIIREDATTVNDPVAAPGALSKTQSQLEAAGNFVVGSVASGAPLFDTHLEVTPAAEANIGQSNDALGAWNGASSEYIPRASSADSQIFHFDVDVHRVLELAAQSDDADIRERSERGRQLLHRLQELGALSDEDGYKVLVDELSNDLNHLGSIHSQLMGEIASLQQALRAVSQHNAYLRQQLDIYQSYLKNVRIQASQPARGTLTVLQRINRRAARQARNPTRYLRRFSYAQFERQGVLVALPAPKAAGDLKSTEQSAAAIKQQISFVVQAASGEGTIQLSLHIRGREKPIDQLAVQLDDLLDKQVSGCLQLCLGPVQLSIAPLVTILARAQLLSC